MLPAEAGRLLVRVTVTVCPSVTTSVGPGTCIVVQNGVVLVAGTKLWPADNTPPVQPYPQEYTDCPSG